MVSAVTELHVTTVVATSPVSVQDSSTEKLA